MSVVSIIATGDIHLGQGDPDAFLAEVAPVLQQGEITIGNLEGPASDLGSAVLGKIALRMPPTAIPALRRAGVDVVSVANNHGMDYGADALLDTLQRLDAEGIRYAGGGRNREDAWRAALVAHDGSTIAFLSFTFIYEPTTFPATATKPGLACVAVDTAFEIYAAQNQAPGTWPRSRTWTRSEDKQAVLDEVRRARQHADVVLVGCHWGLSGLSTAHAMGIPTKYAPNVLMDYQLEMGHAIIDAGALVVIGNHPHRLQGVEPYREGLICYSLGNFAFAYERLPHFTYTSGLLQAEIDTEGGTLRSWRIVPITLDRDTYRPHVAAGQEVDDICAELNEVSEAIGTELVISERGLVAADNASNDRVRLP